MKAGYVFKTYPFKHILLFSSHLLLDFLSGVFIIFTFSDQTSAGWILGSDVGGYEQCGHEGCDAL
jgi:hypothetical protein